MNAQAALKGMQSMAQGPIFVRNDGKEPSLSNLQSERPRMSILKHANLVELNVNCFRTPSLCYIFNGENILQECGDIRGPVVELDCWPTGRAFNPAPGAYDSQQNSSHSSRLSPAQQILAVQNRGVKRPIISFLTRM